MLDSNVTDNKIEELLSAVSVSKEHKEKITFWIQNFEQFLDNLTQCSDVQLDEIVKIKRRKHLTDHQKFINELFSATVDFTCDENLTLKFGQPECFKIIGAYGLDSSIKCDLQVNISLKIPESYFDKKDYLNNRYSVRCYYYLVYIYAKLKETVLYSKIDIVFYNGIKALPFLQIVPDFYEGNVFNVYASGPESHFKLNRLEPNHNNITFDTDMAFHDIEVSLFSKYGTPLYNSVIAKDLTLHRNYEYMENTLNVRNIQDACKLIQVWLLQRNLIKGFGNFGEDTVFYVMAYLVGRKKINHHMSSFQIVQQFWAFLCKTNWSKTPISLCDDVNEIKFNSYRDNYNVVFLDKTGFYNVTSFLNLDVYLKVRKEAALAINMLDAKMSNAFSSLFLMDLPFIFQYDAIAKINNIDCFKSVYKSAKDIRKWYFYGFYNCLVTEEVINTVKQGFGAAARAVVPYITEINADVTNINFFKMHLTFGISLNQEGSFNTVLATPSAEEAKIDEFRRFWKSRSDSLQRNDGTFSEDVHFNCDSLSDRRHIFKQVIALALSDNLNLCVYVISDQFEKLLIGPNGKCAMEENCFKIKEVYDDFNKMLRSLDLTLSISEMWGTSDVFSCTELITPRPLISVAEKHISPVLKNCLTIKQKIQYNTMPKYVYPIVCVIQLETSRWPTDIKVLRSLKIIFYFQICTLLQLKYNVPSKVDEKHLDVFYKGLLFRIKLYLPKEVELLKRYVISENSISLEDTAESVSLTTDLTILPQITAALTGLNSKLTSFGLCTALIKRWLRSQLLDGYHISDTVINLLSSSIYLNSAPFEKATLPQAGFLRFLKFTSDPNWYRNPIVVNFNNELKRDNLDELIANCRNEDHHGLYIITPYDNGKSVFTKSGPTTNVLKRMSLLATEACKIVDQTVMDWKPFHIKNLFVPSLKGYNVLIYLKENLNTLANMQVVLTDQRREKSPQVCEADETVMPIINFNPVDVYLQELREIFEGIALFFHDTYGGNVIGVLWTKQALQEKKYKLENVCYTRFYNNKLILNTELIVTDFGILGEGIVQSIKKL